MQWPDGTVLFGPRQVSKHEAARRLRQRRRFTATAEMLERRELLSLANDNFLQGTVFVDSMHTGQPAFGDQFQSGVVINLTGSDGSARSTTTDSNGQYLFDNLPTLDGSSNQITYTLSEVAPSGFGFNNATALTQIDTASVSANSITVKFPTATSVSMQWNGVVGANNVPLAGDILESYQRPGGLGQPQGLIPDMVGQLQFLVGPVADGSTQKLDSYCVGLFSGLGNAAYPSFTQTASSYFAAQKASNGLPVYSGQIGYLFNNFGTAPPTTNTTIPTPGGPVSVTPAEFTDGLQYALWKLELDQVNFTDPTQSFNDPNSILYIPTPPNSIPVFDANVYWTAVQLIKQSANQNDLAMVLNFDTSNTAIFGQEMLATRSFDFINNIPSSQQPSGSISGTKFLDLTGNGMAPGNPALGGVTIDLFQDADGDGGALDSSDTKIGSQVTAPITGAYSFSNLAQGIYFVKEEVPSGFTMTTPASPGYYTVTLDAGQNANGYNFADYEGPLKSGDAATIGFWANKNGQALLLSLNGGPRATNLASWLTSNFPNLYPTSLVGKTNQTVASYFTTVKGHGGNKVEAQVMAVALAMYVTDGALAGNAAASYGFNVTANGGTGDKSVNVGLAGSLLGLSNNTNYAIFQVLQAANAVAVNGTIDAGDSTKRGIVETVFDYINTHGDIK